MPMGASQYGFLNAKLRTRLGKLLPDDIFDTVRKSKTLSEGVAALSGTPYSRLSGTLEAMEADILYMEIEDFFRIVSTLKGTLNQVGNALMVRYEVELLKRVLRCVFARAVLRQDPYDPAIGRIEGLFPHLPLSEVLNSADLDQAENKLSGTVYASLVRDKKAEVMLTGSMFPLETHLDRHFFTVLQATIIKLPSRDRDIAGRITGIEIDLENISIICRLTGFYPKVQNYTPSLFIPGGFKTEPRNVIQAAEGNQPLDSLGTYLGQLYPGFETLLAGGKGSITGRLSLFESVLESILDREIRRILLGNPFTIGILLAYTILKRREFRKLVSALNSAAYGGSAGKP